MSKTEKIDEKNNQFIVTYENEAFDISSFIFLHPGGINTLLGKKNKNIDVSFKNAQHSEAAKYLLQEYSINANKNNDDLEVKLNSFVIVIP
jgi:cytochrome b involved in lipid metabolism